MALQLTNMSKIRKIEISPSPIHNKQNRNVQSLTFKNMNQNKHLISNDKHHTPRTMLNFGSIFSDSSSKDDQVFNADRNMHLNRGQSPFASHHNNKSHQKRLLSNQEQYLCIIKSKEKQIKSLNHQVSILTNTVDLLQTQTDTLKKQNRDLTANPMREIQAKLVQNQRLIQQRNYLKNELKQFEQIVPKLNELESIQNKLIEQNRKYKTRQQSMRLLLKNIKNAINQQPSQLSQKINQMILSHLY